MILFFSADFLYNGLMEKTNYDVLIIGAGPAGSEAAYHIAKAGYEVLVIEQGPLSREKICGGGLFVQEIRDFGPLPQSVIEREIRTLRVHAPHDVRTVALPPELPSGVIVRRQTYDLYLQQRAQDAGAMFLEQTPALGVEFFPDKVICRIGAGGKASVLSAGLVLDASGWNSLVARQQGLRLKPDQFIAAYKCWLELPSDVFGQHFSDTLDFYFDPAWVEDGYVWIFPKKTVLDVGIGCLACHVIEKKIDLKQRLQTFIKQHPILRQATLHFAKGGYIPAALYPQLFYPRTLLLGDAGGIASPLHGGGIYYARYSGRAAATASLAFLHSGDPACLAAYQETLQTELYQKDFYWDQKLRPFLGQPDLIDLLVHASDTHVDQFFVDTFTGTVPHQQVYTQITDTVQRLMAREYPVVTPGESRPHIPVPDALTLADFQGVPAARVLVAISYCIKDPACPVGKFTPACGKCHKCSVAALISQAQRYNFSSYIVTTSTAFIAYLDEHEHQFDRLIAIACPAIANRMALLVHRKYGLKGYVALLRGDICQTDDAFHHSEQGLKVVPPTLDLTAIQKLLDKISWQVN